MSDRELAIYRDRGKILAAAMARLVEAYECDPDRACHVLEWEHLPGRNYRSNLVTPEVEEQIATAEDGALRHLRLTALHQGNDASLEYDCLLKDWYSICGTATEYDLDLYNFMSEKHGQNWHLSNRFLTASELEKRRDWTPEEIDGLRHGDPISIGLYRKELERTEHAMSLRQAEKSAWIEQELTDLQTVADRKLFNLRCHAVYGRLAKWEEIEEARVWAEHLGLQHLWLSAWESNPGIDFTPPKETSQKFPESLPKDIGDKYQRLKELEKKLWNSSDVKMLADSESLIDRLIRMSMKNEDSAGIKAFIKMKDSERKERAQAALPASFGWHGWYGALLDDEAEEQSEYVRRGRSDGKLYIQWAKELIGLLPAIVDRSAKLEAHALAEFGDLIQPALRELFEQAHLCYLFGFEIPCTLTCGALVEEAFQVRFQEMFGAWDKEYKEARKRGEQPHSLAFWEKIDRVVALNPFASPARQLANGVWAARTKAMHKPDEYVRQERYKSATILSDARKILQILFERE